MNTELSISTYNLSTIIYWSLIDKFEYIFKNLQKVTKWTLLGASDESKFRQRLAD